MKTLILLAIISLACAQIVTINFGCKSFNADSTACLECSKRYYLDSKGICQPVSDSCNTYDKISGACTSCYDGFILLEIVCVKDKKSADPNCANFTNNACHKCSRGFYLKNSVCEMVNPLCRTFDYQNQICNECYGGYKLANNTCIVDYSSSTMPYCAKFNGSVCIECTRDSYMNEKGDCIHVDSSCKTFNKTNGVCLSCFPGYTLNNSVCAVAPDELNDPNCKKFENSVCVECSKGFYFNLKNVCIQVDPFCKTFNYTVLTCIDCYSGFTLKKNICIYDQSKPSYDVNCKKFDSNAKCLECSKGFYFDSKNVCVQTDPNCKNLDLETKRCSSCYSGYVLQEGSCQRENSSVSVQKNCVEELDGVCIKCPERAYLDINNHCIMVSDFCKTFNDFNGFCTTCYTGYSLEQTTGKCLPSESASAKCVKTNPSTGACTQCVKGYYLDVASQCQQIDTFCQTFNFASLKCDLCYKGYILNSKNACTPAPIMTAPAIKNCVSYDQTGANCIKCYNLYYLKDNACFQADPLCKTFNDKNGACLTCYGGFTLQDGKCQYL